jgi:hypothetical protein
MNFRQGFFRIWVVGSILFIGAVGVFSYDKVSGEFNRASLDFSNQGILLVPVLCRDARGKVNVDYSPPEGPWTDYTASAGICWYQIDVLRRFYPEYKDLSQDVVSDRLYKKAGMVLDPARPWGTLGWVLLIALGIPAFVLLLGMALGWALSGFFSTRPKQTT